MEDAKSTLRKLKLSSTLTSSIFESIEYYHDKSPWKIIPGPWLIRITKEGLDDRYCAILGCSDKNQRGLAIYTSISDYLSRPPLPKALALMFQNGKKKLPVFYKTNGYSMVLYILFYGKTKMNMCMPHTIYTIYYLGNDEYE